MQNITHKGNSHSAKEILHANILLLTNERYCYPNKKRSSQEVADIFRISKTTVNQVRKIYAEQGVQAALTRKTRLTPPVASKITGELEAHFMFTEPLGGRRHVLAKEHRKRGDFAQMMLSIAEKYYPDVKKIILVADKPQYPQPYIIL